MPVELATAYISLVPSMKGAQGAIAQEFNGLGGAGSDGGKKLGGGIVSGLKGALGPVAAITAGVFGAKAIVDWGKASIDALANIEAINAQTASAIRSTGGAAGVTADHVEELALSLEGMTATEAESIQQGANMLLTFKNIQNGVGEGNDIFDQATTSLVDMARAMGTEPQSAAIQLGKALNDPIAGISALSRMGIQFTDDQKKVIESLVETGDVAGAQKIILAELNSQFGGSGAAYAETYAGKISLMKDAWGDLGQSIFSYAMPAITGVVGLLTSVAGGIQGVIDLVLGGDFTSAFADAFNVTEDSGIVDYILDIREAFLNGGLIEAAQTMFGGLADWIAGGGLQTVLTNLLVFRTQLFEAILGALPGIVQGISTMIPAIVSSFAEMVPMLLNALVGMIPQLVAGFTTLITSLASVLVTLIPQLVGIITTIIGSLAGVLVTLIPQLVTVITTALPQVITALLGMLPALLTAAITLFQSIITAIVTVLPLILTALVGMLPSIVTTVVTMLPMLLQAAIQLFLALVQAVVTILPDLLMALLDALPDILSTLLGMLPQLLTAAIELFFALVMGLLEVLPDLLTTLITEVLPKVITTLIQMLPQLLDAAIQLFGALLDGLSENVPILVSFIFTDLIPSLVGAIIDAAPQLLDAGADLIQSFIDGIGSMIGGVGDAIGGIMDFVGGFFPHSPAKHGPLSGAGWRAIGSAGEAISEEFAAGIRPVAVAPLLVGDMPSAASVAGYAASIALRGGGVGAPAAGLVVNGNVYGDPEDIVDELETRRDRVQRMEMLDGVGV